MLVHRAIYSISPSAGGDVTPSPLSAAGNDDWREQTPLVITNGQHRAPNQFQQLAKLNFRFSLISLETTGPRQEADLLSSCASSISLDTTGLTQKVDLLSSCVSLSSLETTGPRQEVNTFVLCLVD